MRASGSLPAFTSLVLIGALGAPVLHARGQDAAIAPATFDVATVRINKTGELGTQISAPAGTGRIALTNMQLRAVIQAAYSIQQHQLVNLPKWAETERVDIVAKADPSASIRQLQVMLQPLLAERFKLAVHREMRDIDVYTLSLANRDGQLGPRLKKSEANCDAVAEAPRNAQPAPPAGRPRCGITPGGPGHFILTGIAIPGFAGLLALPLQRQVIDETGLTGGYDIDVQYTPDQFAAAALALRPGATAPDGVDPNGPSLVTALQEQLGLKLEAKKRPAPVLVVDHIEQLVGD